MSETPERIFVDASWFDEKGYLVGGNDFDTGEYMGDVEYVRADLYEELQKLLHEASQMMVADVIGYAERNSRNNWVTRANDRSNT